MEASRGGEMECIQSSHTDIFYKKSMEQGDIYDKQLYGTWPLDLLASLPGESGEARGTPGYPARPRGSGTCKSRASHVA